MDHTLLFLCTGNYYRSRFAEMVFNTQASRLGLDWRADSRGLQLGADNIGPIYPLVLVELRKLGIDTGRKPRMPIQVEEKDLARADRIIALDSREHFYLMQKLFPAWADRIEYWNVPDLNVLDAAYAFSSIQNEVTALIDQLRSP